MLLESNGFNLSTFHEYYVITLNSTTQVSGTEVHERYVLINEIRGGMWKSCAVLSGNPSSIALSAYMISQILDYSIS